jgi:hypothetical protein
MDPRIRIHAKMSWIRNTALYSALCSGGGSAERARPAPVVADGRPARRQRPSRGQPGNRQRAGSDLFCS